MILLSVFVLYRTSLERNGSKNTFSKQVLEYQMQLLQYVEFVYY